MGSWGMLKTPLLLRLPSPDEVSEFDARARTSKADMVKKFILSVIIDQGYLALIL